MADDLIRRSDVLAAIETALNNATGDLFDAYSAVKTIPAVTPTVQEAAKVLLAAGNRPAQTPRPRTPQRKNL